MSQAEFDEGVKDAKSDLELKKRRRSLSSYTPDYQAGYNSIRPPKELP
jgi:hypothetical protein